MLKENFTYLFGRVFPAAATLCAVVVYTHIMSPQEYGLYALYYFAATLTNIALYQWLRLSFLRYFAEHEGSPALLKLTTLAIFSCISILVLLIGYGLSGLPIFKDDKLLFAASVLSIAIAWGEINQEMLRTRSRAWDYSMVYFMRVVLGAALGIFFIMLNYGGQGLLWGLALGNVIPTLLYVRKNWFDLKLVPVDVTLIKKIIRYGLPLTLNYSINGLTNGIDKLVLGYFLGPVAVAPFSVAFDIAKGSLWNIAQGSNLGAMPRATKALVNHGAIAAQIQLRHNLHFLLAIIAPACLGICLVSTPLSIMFLDSAYSKIVSNLMPIIALATTISALKAFYIDQSFQLAYRTHHQVLLTFITLAVSAGVACLLIPYLGIKGAGWSSLTAYSFSLIISAFYSIKSFILPLPRLRSMVALILSLLSLSLGVFVALAVFTGITSLIVSVLLGGFFYCASMFFLNYEGCYQKLKRLRCLQASKLGGND